MHIHIIINTTGKHIKTDITDDDDDCSNSFDDLRHIPVKNNNIHCGSTKSISLQSSSVNPLKEKLVSVSSDQSTDIISTNNQSELIQCSGVTSNTRYGFQTIIK